jgi:hypothetical protein
MTVNLAWDADPLHITVDILCWLVQRYIHDDSRQDDGSDNSSITCEMRMSDQPSKTPTS